MQILMKCAMLQLHRLSGEPSRTTVLGSHPVRIQTDLSATLSELPLSSSHIWDTQPEKYTDVDPVCVCHSSTSPFLYSLNSLWISNNVGDEPENKSEPHSSISRSSAHSFCPVKVPMQYETDQREDLTESWWLHFAKPQSPSPTPGQRYRMLSCPLFTWTLQLS
jgi:hypothetical protein